MTVVNSVASNNALPLPSTGAGTATDTTLAAFQGWTAAVQVAFINNNHAGNPPQVVLGPTGSQQGLATLNADGTVTTETLPSGFTSAPAKVDYATFASWSQNVEAAYMLANSAKATSDDTTLFLTCGSGTATFTATRPVPPKLYSPSDLTTIQAPDVSVPVALGTSILADLTTGYTSADIPYFQVGSAAGDTTVATKAATIYTTAAGTTSPSATPYTTLDPQTFEAWTTEQQRAYITAQIAANPSSLKATTPFTIGSGSAAIDVFIGAGSTAASPAPVYIVQNLQKTDIAKMSFKDQQTLTAAAGYPTLAAAYGLMPNATTQASGATSATATIQALITSYRSTVTSSTVPPYVQSLYTAQIDLISAQLFGGSLPSAPVAGTTTLVPTAPTLPSPQTSGSAIFSETDIQAQLDAIQTRFKRVAAFAAQATKYNPPTVSSFDYVDSSTGQTLHYTYDQNDEKGTGGTTPSGFVSFYEYAYNLSATNFGADAAGVHTYGKFTVSQTPDMTSHTMTLNGQSVKVGLVTNIVLQNSEVSFNITNGVDPLPASTDNDVTIRSGYEKFVAQEATIVANKMLAANLAQSGTVAGSNQSLDMPKLLCLYMMYNNNIQQAVVTADSEEINQVNAVLQEYAAAQQIVNATVATSTSNANTQLPAIYGSSSNAEVARYFESNYFYNNSPIESLYFGSSWQRPLTSRFIAAGSGGAVSASDTANNWTQYGTQLSDAVTQINQQSQIKMNDVNSETKQQDRYFDLASTALSKLSDTLAQIASAT